MLSLLLVQVFAAAGLVALLGGFLLWHSPFPFSRGPVRVVATRSPARGTEGAWVLGAVVSVLWPVGVLLAPEYAYHWPKFPDFPGSGMVQLAGLVLGASSGVLFYRAARTMGRQMTPKIQVQEGHQLMQTGPFRYIRHPVYTAIVGAALGETLFLLSLPLGLITLMMVGLAFYRARLEEALLRSPDAFGAAYDSYMARTGRFLPRWRDRP
ncbi:MAG: methyltransferase family protein [Thermoplasmata archaeon]